jgi:tellurite resistance protein TerC
MNVLHVPPWAWAATAAALAVLLGTDLFVSARRRGPERLGEAALWTAAAIALAVAFGALVALAGSGAAAGQFFAGWLTEYSLSLDNLVVFVLLISSSGVARQYHGRVLLLGILLALVFRGLLIAVGGAALHRFAWVEYLFGAFLIYVAARMALRRGGPSAGAEGGGPLRAARLIMPVAARGDGARLTTRVDGRRHATPLLVLVIAIGVTDVLFAVDSIPAIFGLTRDPFLVFSANLFALLGLRHLYFLVGGLLERLVYLSAGLAVILGFIGLKLIAEALRAYGIDHLGPVPIPAMSAGVSLTVIAGVLVVTTVSSLVANRRRARRNGAAHRMGQTGEASQPEQAGQAGRASQPEQPGQAGRASQPEQAARAEQVYPARQADQTGPADEEGWPGTERRYALPWADQAPAAGPDGRRLCAHRSSGGHEGVTDMWQDVSETHADRLAGRPPGDLHRTFGQATLAHGDPQRDAGQFGVAELHPGPLGPVVDDDLDAGRGELLVHRFARLGDLGVLGLGHGDHDAERGH